MRFLFVLGAVLVGCTIAEAQSVQCQAAQKAYLQDYTGLTASVIAKPANCKDLSKEWMALFRKKVAALKVSERKVESACGKGSAIFIGQEPEPDPTLKAVEKEVADCR